jgi:septum formation protein
MGRIILASGSQTRIRLLENACLRFIATAAPVDERTVEKPLRDRGATSVEIAAALAAAKALAVSKSEKDALVIGADQVLDLDGRQWSKAASRYDAAAQLRALSGKTHSLVSAVAAARGGEVVWRHTAEARLTMRSLTDGDIAAYLARVGDAAVASVGAYQIEGPGIRLFERIEGDYFTILGLPLLPLLAFLRQLGEIDP